MKSQIFDFCNHCRVSNKCCQQFGPKSELSAPIVIESELQKIKERFGDLHISDHCSVHKNVTTIKIRKSGSCLFHEKGKCKIYNARPFDCMIFPLDIFKISSLFYWVIYDKFCQQEIEHTNILIFGESIIKKRGIAFLRQFAWDIDKFPCKLSYEVLKEVDIQGTNKF